MRIQNVHASAFALARTYIYSSIIIIIIINFEEEKEEEKKKKNLLLIFCYFLCYFCGLNRHEGQLSY